MKAQKLTALCSAVLFVFVEAMVFGGDVAACAQGVPQQNGASSGNSAMAGDLGNGNGMRRKRHRKHRKHRGGRGKNGMNRMGNNGNQGGNPSGAWNGSNGMSGMNGMSGQSGAGAGDGNFRQGKRHKRYRGGRKRRGMQNNGMGAGTGNQSGGQFGQ